MKALLYTICFVFYLVPITSQSETTPSSSVSFNTYLLIIFTVILLTIAETLRRYLRKMDAKLSHLPSAPRDSWLHGSGKRFFGGGLESLKLVAEWSKKTGYKPWVVPGGILAVPYVIIPTYSDANRLLRTITNKGGIPKLLYYPGMPNTIVTADGNEWKRHRDVLAPAFTAGSISKASPLLNVVARDAVEVIKNQLQDKGEIIIDIHSLCNRIVLDVVGSYIFGASFDAVKNPGNPAHNAAHQLSLLSMKNFTDPLRRLFKIGKSEFDHYEGILDNIALSQMKKCAGDKQDHLLNILPKARDSSNILVYPTKDAYLTELRLTVNAAHDPALPMSFALFEVAKNPKIAQTAFEEIQSVLGDREEIVTADLKNLKYVNAIFLEALRLYPVSGSGTGRYIEKDITVDGLNLPAGTVAMVPFYAILRSDKYFTDPDEFRPERMLGDSKESHKAAMRALLPFSAGPRNCLGMQLAWNECLVILAHLLRNFHFEFQQEVKLECGIHFMPKDIVLKVSPIK